MIREKEKKNFFEVAAVMHRTPLALHPSHPSIVDALARCLNGSNAAVRRSNLDREGVGRGVYSECRIYQPKEGYGTLDSRGGHF